MVQLNINKASGGGHTCLRDCSGKECISLVTSISKATVITETRGIEIYQPWAGLPSGLKGS